MTTGINHGEALEALIDSHGLPFVLGCLSDICHLKARLANQGGAAGYVDSNLRGEHRRRNGSAMRIAPIPPSR